MAGNLNSDSIIWVVGDTVGKDASGATVGLPYDVTASGVSHLASLGYVDAVAANLATFHARLVASGIIES